MSIKYQWAVTTLNPKTDKKSIDHALHSIGYIIMQKPDAVHKFYVVGFKYTGKYPLAHHAQIATEEQSKRLEEAFRRIYTVA